MKTSWNKGIPESAETKLKKAATFAAKRAILPKEKACNKCGEIKELELFPKKKDMKDGRHGSCKVCEGKRKSKYKYTTEQWSDWRRKKKFGLEKDDYNYMLKEQNYSCAICNIKLNDYVGIYGKGKKLDSFTVDHDHTTGKIRGLTCFRCNLMLGYGQDNPAILEAGANYLKEKAHQGGLSTGLINS